MADLFDQLKSEGPVKKTPLSPAKSITLLNSNFTNTLNPFDEEHKTSSTRRESMPSPNIVNNVSKKTKSYKARSLSPPKYDAKNVIKSLKVKLERKKIEEFLTRPLEDQANDFESIPENVGDVDKQPKITPTKAQQKLFEPSSCQKNNSNVQMPKQFNVKACKVRIHRDNLQKLAKEFKNKSYIKSKNVKRSASSTLSESPPSKKGKAAALDNKNNKNKNNFFIKLNASPTSKFEKKLKNFSKSSPSSEALHNKIKNSKFNSTTPPTKFSRSELFRSFGKRFFNVHVKIERCSHPLMLTFESNDRARRLQAKRNKSKNLSVSFSEQVEIFGGSSDSEDSCEDFSGTPNNRNGRKINVNQSLSVPAAPVVMPARLKKVENGKVVDDIELDPSLFLDPKMLTTSTPFSPGRKKRDHKSFSPLKDESSPSPRKEKLKLANEGIPPGGLKRLSVEEDEDEDDDCEYIVPIEMPQRRTSRTSSIASIDDLTSASLPLSISPINFPIIFNNDNVTTPIENGTEINECTTKDNEKENSGAPLSTINLQNDSDDSFLSANDNFDKSNEINSNENQFQPLRFSPTSDMHLDLGSSKGHGIEQLQQSNGNVCNDVSSKHLAPLNTMDISLNLFLEDSQTNEDDTNAKSFVDTLISETIDKLSKDIDEHAIDKHYTDTT